MSVMLVYIRSKEFTIGIFNHKMVLFIFRTMRPVIGRLKILSVLTTSQIDAPYAKFYNFIY
jgi:hypothetical protein